MTAIALMAKLGVKACIIVHKSVLAEQWYDSITRFCPNAKVGYLKGSLEDVADCDIVIAMILTLAKRDYDPQLMRTIGLVCVDEAHHLAARVFHQSVRHFCARYVLGLMTVPNGKLSINIPEGALMPAR